VHSTLPQKHGKFEGAWSLLNRAEDKDHLYVTAAAIFLLPVPVTWNIKGNVQIEKNKAKTVTLPGNDAKNFVRNKE